MNGNVRLPSIIIGTHDYYRLTGAAEIGRQHGNDDAEFLLTELGRAVITHPDSMPDDVVSINSRVTYRLNDDPAIHTRVLVHAGDVSWPSAELSVMTPLGTALLGLRVGDRMPFQTSDGQQHEALVVDVGFRPLAGDVPYERLPSCPRRAGNAVPAAATRLPENSRERLDRRLDAALEETFPASDPISVVVSS
jgi:transcription elongation GreA/GreB family factor